MRIRNEYHDTVHWRAFKGDDTAYITGLYQGVVSPGNSQTWRDDSYDTIKVEVKLGDIVFSSKVLAHAGRKFKMTDDLIVSSTGALDVAQVKYFQLQQPQHINGSDIQFYDARGNDRDWTRTITSSAEMAFTDTRLTETMSSHEQTWTVGGKFGGVLGKEDSSHASAEISAQFEDKVISSLRTSNEKTLSLTWEKSVSDTLTFSPGKLYAIETVWTLTLDRGTASYFGETTSFSVVRSAEPGIVRPLAFNGPEELPTLYQKEWQRRHATNTRAQGV